MNRIIANKISSVLNTPKIMDTLNEYIDFRIEMLRESLEKSDDINMIRKLQGSLEELRRFKKIRDHALQVLEQEKNDGNKR